MDVLQSLPRKVYRRQFSVLEHGGVRCAVSGAYANEATRLLAPDNDQVRQMLRELRERTGFSRAYVAALLNVPAETMRRWEDGSRSPSGAARRLIWWLRQALFEPAAVTNTEQVITWGRR